MDKKFLNFLAICGKINIDNNPSLTNEEKEFYKEFIEYLKKQVKRSAN